MEKAVTFEDCDRIIERGYLHITEQMIQELMSTEDIDEWRDILFRNTVQGYEISFALTYDVFVEYIRNRLTKGKGKKRQVQVKIEDLEPEGEKQPVIFKHAKKRQWGAYRRSESIPYTSKEVFLLERLIKMGYHSGSIFEIYNQSYDVKSKSAVVTKVGRIRKGTGAAKRGT
jgi:hypothetical protein